LDEEVKKQKMKSYVEIVSQKIYGSTLTDIGHFGFRRKKVGFLKDPMLKQFY